MVKRLNQNLRWSSRANRTLQPHLPGWKAPKIGRTLRHFRALQFLKPVGGTRKYYLTTLVAGRQLTGERVTGL